MERFARGDQARTSEGNGLGLAIVSAYTKALGGEFDIRIDCDQFKACLEFNQTYGAYGQQILRKAQKGKNSHRLYQIRLEVLLLKSFPQPLTAAEERYYMQKYTEGDLEAKHILIERNLRLVPASDGGHSLVPSLLHL